MDRKIAFTVIIYLAILKSAIAGGFTYVFPLGFGFGATTITDSDTTLSYEIIDCGGSGVGVTVNESLTGIKIYNLTILNCDTAISLGSDAEVKNVLFENNTTDIGGAGTPTTATNYASTDGNPLLTSAFRIPRNSPAYGAGTFITGLHDAAGATDGFGTVLQPQTGKYIFDQLPAIGAHQPLYKKPQIIPVVGSKTRLFTLAE